MQTVHSTVNTMIHMRSWIPRLPADIVATDERRGNVWMRIAIVVGLRGQGSGSSTRGGFGITAL